MLKLLVFCLASFKVKKKEEAKSWTSSMSSILVKHSPAISWIFGHRRRVRFQLVAECLEKIMAR